MTTTEQSPQDEQQAPDWQPADDSSALIPGLLAVVSAYMVYRAARGPISRSWQVVVDALGVRASVGGQLARIASRALGRERQAAGRPGDELWGQADTGIRDGVTAGLRTIGEALIWSDRHAPGGPVTDDISAESPGVAVLPTAGSPPDLLAQMTVLAVANAAVISASRAAGWMTKKWVTQHDNRVRETHVALGGTSVPMNDPFVSPSGAKLRYPGDPRAPMSERAGCRCFLTAARR